MASSTTALPPTSPSARGQVAATSVTSFSVSLPVCCSVRLSATRLLDIGCFILRGSGLLVADPLAVGGILEGAAAGAGGPLAEKKASLTENGADALGVRMPQGALLLDHTAPGLWGVLAAIERMQPMGGSTGAGSTPRADTGPFGGSGHPSYSTGGGDMLSLMMDEGSSVNALFLLNSAHMQMQQAELSMLQGLPWESFAGRVTVSSGQLGVFTTQSMRDATEACERSTPQAVQATASYWYNRACELTCSEHQVGILDVSGGPVGCVTATGISEEGQYAVYVLRSAESDEIWAVKVDFLSS
ncbi:hypothetical protein BESB_016390 [Besnoitia besnoiti]|uniref:Uncharacterized protein n=1 Tax=Besnoitia besnoiti TaxID=94643 RepID=A0A2A9M7P7_BESBE|nr:hypothetical protein BESB_016390 [Besnoitia besnoiti]PFH32321.1 hypothetical protein BESB_016390 [Besnoitia besnoiti]